MPHWAIQICLQSENKKIYFIDVSCPSKDIFNLRLYMNCILTSLELSNEGKTFDEAPSENKLSIMEKFIYWMDSDDNLQKSIDAVGWVFKLSILIIIYYYFS